MAALNGRWGVRPFRAAFVPSYTARCIIRTIAARGSIKLLGKIISMNICIRCKGSNTVTGKIRCWQNNVGIAFKPDNMKFWSFSLTNGVTISKISNACLDCGLIWNEANPDELKSFVSKKCKNRN